MLQHVLSLALDQKKKKGGEPGGRWQGEEVKQEVSGLDVVQGRGSDIWRTAGRWGKMREYKNNNKRSVVWK